MPLAAQGHEGQGGEVVAGENAEAFGAAFQDAAGLGHVAGGFLDARDIGKVVGQAGQGGGQEVAAGAPGHVVGHQGQVHGLGNGLVVLVEAFLGGFVVVGGDKQGAVGPGFLGEAGQADGLCGIVGAGPGQYGHAALGLVDADFYDALVFLMAEGGGFAGGATGHQAVDARVDLVFDEGPVGGLVQAVVAEWGDQGGQGTGK
jgi:hypothetical protein